MPKPTEVAEIAVNGQRYSNFETVSVSRSGVDPFPKFAFTAASPIESAPNWAGMKLGIGDECEVILGGRQAISRGRITGRQPAYDAQQHGLQIVGTTNSATVVRATVDHNKGEFKGYKLSQIANAALKPYGTKFSTKGDTAGMDQPFEKVAVQFGETVFAFIERLCRMRNAYILCDKSGDLVGYRLDNAVKTIADLQEGRNILAASANFNYEGALSEIQTQGQRPGNDQRFGDAARDQSATVKNSSVKQHVPLVFAAEMPGDQAEMRMRAQHENGYNLADQLTVQITVQGWFRDESSLWLEHVGDPVSVYSPMLFTNDRLNLAIQAVNSTQGPAGTLSQLTLVLPGAYNGGDQVQTGGTPPGLYGAA
ncbi:prophage tail gpP-like protein [Methylobacterium brachiatum]|jgi:prophage tail gpP-like protein|uniref:Prophage tail gpP-like protein n=1 Tax=Methylobacterium brachiatum TaxID=269660 RepID=A0AAJ1TNE8_9HYPH|nr:hypothetical protein [Methylobacterium brachiatum]MCB4803517.1 hypothetical protein [Methylobacterium brachiatum]MDQ0541954.1 prophage tail gpP-like protein [Methylobacterium brachiatum]